jgi:hypothetical protein
MIINASTPKSGKFTKNQKKIPELPKKKEIRKKKDKEYLFKKFKL